MTFVVVSVAVLTFVVVCIEVQNSVMVSVVVCVEVDVVGSMLTL